MEIKELKDYANDVLKNKNNPGILSDLQIEMAAKYAFISEIWKDLQIEKAMYWKKKEYSKYESNGIQVLRDKPLSDKAVEMMWLQEEGGQKEIRLKIELKSLEKLLSAIKSSIVVSSQEAKNQY